MNMTPNDILVKIFQNSFLTGSWVYNQRVDIKHDADWDIVIPYHCKDEYVQLLTDNFSDPVVEHSEYLDGVKIKVFNNSLEFNLIPTLLNDYRLWYLATIAFTNMWPRTGILDKEQKLAVFEGLRASLRGRLPEMNPYQFNSYTKDVALDARDNTLRGATERLFIEVTRLSEQYNLTPKQIPF